MGQARALSSCSNPDPFATTISTLGLREGQTQPGGLCRALVEVYMIRRVFLPIVAGAPMVLGYCDMLLVVEPVQPTASPGYSSTSATCCCPLLQRYLVLPVAVSGYSSGDEH